MLAILNKEFKSFFYSAIGFIFLGVFIFILGLFFATYNVLQGNGDYTSVFSYARYLFVILVPILTMKTISEERRTKTDQLLLTSPIKTTDIVFGKFFAAVGVFLLTLVITLIYPVILSFYTHIAFSEVFCNYIGFFLLGSCLIALGVFASSLTENQVIAAVIAFGFVLLVNIFDSIASFVPATAVSGFIFVVIIIFILSAFIFFMLQNILFPVAIFIVGSLGAFLIFIMNKTLFEGFAGNFVNAVSVNSHYQPFSMGIFDLPSVIFYISFSFFFLFLTVQAIEKRRWA